MASTINAISGGAGGLATAGDATGVLQIQTGGVTAITVGATQNVTVTGSLTAGSYVGVPSVGVGQTWQAVTRISGTTYTNSTGKPIMVNAFDGYSANLTGYQTLQITVDGVTVATNRQYLATENGSCFVSAIVPSGSSYVVTISGSFTALTVRELR